MAYELKLKEYQGPIEKLLELIESRELEITAISLAAVTDDFLKYLEELTATYNEERARGVQSLSAEMYMRLLADFIVIASRLVFIKSKALMPEIKLSEDEESQINDLEERLRLYKELKPAMKELGIQWRQGSHEFSREYFLHVKGLLLAIRAQQGDGEAFFYPGQNLASQPLLDALRKILVLTEVPVAEEKLAQEKIISLENTIKEMIVRIEGLKETTFKGMVKGASRVEAVVAFLAILHLAREQMVSLEQEDNHSDIIIRHATTS